LSGGENGWAVVSFDSHGGARGDALTITQALERYEVQVDPWTAEAVIRRR
jgi:hypothetical protein